VILGASFDAPDENRAFAEAQEFPFKLLSDVDRRVGAAYEVVRPAGERYPEFPLRYSYLIDPQGIIRRSYDVTDVAGHAVQVLADIDELRGDASSS
jgi:peroxiredoxin Q/BCP